MRVAAVQMLRPHVLRLPAPWTEMSPMLRHGLVAGTAWGVALAAGLVGLNTMQCGAFCAPDALTTLAVSVPAGLLTVGPLASLGR